MGGGFKETQAAFSQTGRVRYFAQESRIRKSRLGRCAIISSSPPRAWTSRCKVLTCMSPCDSMRDRVGCLMPRLAATSAWVIPAAWRISASSISAIISLARAYARARDSGRIRLSSSLKFLANRSVRDYSVYAIVVNKPARQHGVAGTGVWARGGDDLYRSVRGGAFTIGTLTVTATLFQAFCCRKPTRLPGAARARNVRRQSRDSLCGKFLLPS